MCDDDIDWDGIMDERKKCPNVPIFSLYTTLTRQVTIQCHHCCCPHPFTSPLQGLPYYTADPVLYLFTPTRPPILHSELPIVWLLPYNASLLRAFLLYDYCSTGSPLFYTVNLVLYCSTSIPVCPLLSSAAFVSGVAIVQLRLLLYPSIFLLTPSGYSSSTLFHSAVLLSFVIHYPFPDTLFFSGSFLCVSVLLLLWCFSVRVSLFHSFLSLLTYSFPFCVILLFSCSVSLVWFLFSLLSYFSIII